MLKRPVRWGAGLLGMGAGVVAAGASAAAVVALVKGNQYLDHWQNLTPEEVAEGEFCELSNGWRIHYLAQGQGSPVILLHGFMDSAHSWRQNITALAVQHRVLALDLPGFGGSTRVVEPVYSLKRVSQVLHEFLTLQGITRASLIGHSMGGALAVQFTYDFPESVDKLVLESAAVYLPLPKSRSVPDWIPPVIARGVLGLVAMGGQAVLSTAQPLYGGMQARDAESRRLRARTLRVQGTTEALVAMFGSPRESDLPDAVPHIEQPTLIIWGGRDWILPVADAHRLRRELPQARLAVLHQAGHLPHEQFPGQVNELLNGFLENGLESLAETVD